MNGRAGQVRPRATCPACGKALAVVARAVGDVFPAHRRPAGGTCVKSLQPVRRRDLVHPCKRCRALPTLEEVTARRAGQMDAPATLPDLRPVVPRPLKARGYCASHLRDVEREQRQRARDKYRENTYGITSEEFDELVAAQGGGCACGLTHSKSRGTNGSQAKDAAVLAVDHDHGRQAECVAAGRHGPETCCRRCVRGGLGRRCNREIVGRFTPDQLRRIADYMERPTAQALGWWDD